MDKNIIVNKIINAITTFVDKEKFLLENDLNERTITHKLAIYVEYEFPKYNIDCEYNRIGEHNIDENFILKELDLPIKKISSNDTKATIVYPDIIVHKRGVSNNLLIIEVKKKKYANKNYKYKSDRMTYKTFDEKKIKAYMGQLEYQYGLYLEFDKINYFGIFYDKEGNEILFD